MPRKKRVLQQRSAADGAASTSGLYRPDEFQPIGDDIQPDGIIRNNFAIGEDIHPAECLRNIQEMFDGKLDADVIHMVLTECEFNVNNALEALFTLLPQESGASAASVIHPLQSRNLSPSTSSESIGAGENIVTSEAEVHKSSEESEHESPLAANAHAAASSPSNLALYVNAAPFVPSLCLPASTETRCPDALKEQGPFPPIAWSQLAASGCQLGFNITPSFSHKPEASPASENELQKIHSLLDEGENVLVLMRGLPGSGKTTLAQKICGRGVVLSADQFFCKGGKYNFDKSRLSEAHEWNKRRAKKFIQEGRSPIIIDNTNVEIWEMMPYVALALRAKYHVCVLEPDTPWKFDARQLTQKNMHGVPRRTIDSMLERYDRNITGELLCLSFGRFPKSPDSSVLPACTPLEIQETSASESPSKPRDKIPLELPLKAHQNPSTSSSEKTSTAAPEETISLGDLIALVQNDSEESGSRSRQNSDSWSSGHDGNDSEDGTERDDDFLWASRKALSSLTQSNVPVNEAILEERDAPEQEASCRLETELEEIKEESECSDTVVEAVTDAWPDVIEEREDNKPKPPRDSPRHLGGSARGDNTPIMEILADFTAPWEHSPEEETLDSLTNTPREQRFRRGKVNPKMTSENSADTSRQIESPHTVPKAAETSKQKHSSARGPIFGLEKVVRSSTWTFPEFNVFEPALLETEVKNSACAYTDASTYADPADFVVVGKVLLGESDELRVVGARDPAEMLDEECIHLAPAYKPNTLARSTDTDDLPTDDLDDEGKLLLLQQCMPGVRPPDLEDIFQHCHGDHVWAADLLLDSNVACDLQPLVINEECDADTTRSPSSKSQQPEALASSVVPAGNEEKHDETLAKTAHTVKEPADKKLKKSSIKTFLPRPENVDREFTFHLDHSFACQLVETFGSEGLHVSMDAFRSVDLNVTISSEIARQIHQLWMDTLKQRMSKEEDEMLEMAANSHESELQHSQTGGEGSSKESAPDIAVPPPALHHDPRWSKAPHEMSFREIMEMEAALEEKRKDWTKNNTYMDMATKLKLKQLYEKFPGVDRQALDEIFVASNYSLIQSVLTINETLGVAPEENDMENIEKQIVDLVEMESMSEQEADDSAWQPVVEGHEDMYDRLRLVGDYDVIRREATVHYHMRQESFRKAKEAYHRGMKTVAAFYSQQGRAYAEKMREANERASWKLLQLRNAQSDDNTLDLHGLHVQEAIQVLKNYVKLKKRESWCLQKKQTLRIITGRGAHSAQNIPKVKFAVESYLLSSQLNYREVQAGMFHVML